MNKTSQIFAVFQLLFFNMNSRRGQRSKLQPIDRDNLNILLSSRGQKMSKDFSKFYTGSDHCLKSYKINVTA